MNTDISINIQYTKTRKPMFEFKVQGFSSYGSVDHLFKIIVNIADVRDQRGFSK